MAGLNVYIINGYSRETGQWQTELFLNKEEAENQFQNYVKEYNANVDETDDWYASCDNGITWFSLEERVVK